MRYDSEMNDLLTFALTVFTGFFAIMNPLAGIPIFLSLTEGADQATRRTMSRRATGVAFIIVTGFVLLGKLIFELFGLTIPAFRIAGGLLIFYVGFEMLQSKKSSVQNLHKVKVDENLAISPLAIPLLAGPGTIVTAMNYVTNATYVHILIVIGVFALMCVVTYLAFTFSGFLVKKIGNNVMEVVSKVMGLMIAIIGTNMVISGVKLAIV